MKEEDYNLIEMNLATKGDYVFLLELNAKYLSNGDPCTYSQADGIFGRVPPKKVHKDKFGAYMQDFINNLYTLKTLPTNKEI